MAAPAQENASGESGTRSQTLDRGLRILEALSAANRPMTVASLAQTLRLHRSIVYRMLRTLEDHRLVSRTTAGSYELGLGLSVLARGVTPDLQSVAVPILSSLANELRMTAFLAVPSAGEAVTLVSVEPRHSAGHIAYAPGTRHRLDCGAPGIAILAASPPHPDERPDVTEARRRGWAYSHGEVLPGMSSVAATISTTALSAAVAVVFLERPEGPRLDLTSLGLRVVSAAEEITGDMT